MAQVRLPVRRGDWLRARLTSVYGPLVRWRAPLVLLAMVQGAANRWGGH